MSPALFTIISYVLSRLLARVEEEGRLNGVEEVAVVVDCLRTYCEWTRQVINLGKASVHFSRNVNRRTSGELCQVLEMHECDHKGKYLGLPYCNFKSKTKAF